jgi:hypothetical protein
MAPWKFIDSASEALKSINFNAEYVQKAENVPPPAPPPPPPVVTPLPVPDP